MYIALGDGWLSTYILASSLHSSGGNAGCTSSGTQREPVSSCSTETGNRT